MFRCVIMSLVLSFGLLAKALPIEAVVNDISADIVKSEIIAQGLKWKVGDQNNYDLNVGTFIKGKMSMLVREISADGVWVDQDQDMGFAGKHKGSALYDINTGELKRLILDGKEQQVKKPNTELIDTKDEEVQVPAGKFESIHARILDKDENVEINAWINFRDIPISGMLKMTKPSQFGEILVELRSFKKN